ncbi:MAG TPA: sensor histidine kinase [Gemmatimonadales bacterium]|jgi:hypothetical protein
MNVPIGEARPVATGWRTTRVVLTVLLIWTALAGLSIVQAALTMPPGAPAMPWGRLVVLRLADWYTCALFIPAFVWLSRRVPVTATRWGGAVALLFAASAVFVVLKYLLFMPIAQWIVPGTSTSFAHLLAGNALIELIIFWAVIAVIQATEFRRRLQQQEYQHMALQAQLTERRLEALGAQLQPHFLFNALNAVATLMHRDVAAADRMIIQLGDLLRESLRRDNAWETTLDDELTLTARYLELMLARFSDRLTIVVEADAEARRGLVPRLILQPLVENALEHGIAHRRGDGSVTISATRRGDVLELTVRDDGPGAAGGPTNGTGVGLRNTRARLEQLYGASQALTLERSADGTIARVVLPWHDQPVLLPGGR